MEIQDIKDEIRAYASKISHWNVLFNTNSEADYQMGYYYDSARNKWITYQTSERGLKMEKEFDDELSALVKLHRYVKFEYKVQNHLI